MRRESNPVARLESGRLVLVGEPYDPETYITCDVYGEMQDGAKVWTDENGKQFTRQKYHGKYFFVPL